MPPAKLRNVVQKAAVAPSKSISSSPSRFRAAFEQASIGMGLIDLKGDFFEANPALCSLFGYSRKELLQLNMHELWLPEERRRAQADFRRAARGLNVRTHFERSYQDKSGRRLCAEVSRGLIRNKLGEPEYFVVSFLDITQRKQQQQLLAEQAATDPLTGALNRGRIEELARFEQQRSERYGTDLSLVLLDLDRFKRVNDLYGHSAGDRVLRGFCDVARERLRTSDLLGRWGGEEFVLFLPGTGVQGAEILAERLRQALAATDFGVDLHITASFGVAARRTGEPFEEWVARADAALYRAKQSGRNRVLSDIEDLESEIVRAQRAPSPREAEESQTEALQDHALLTPLLPVPADELPPAQGEDGDMQRIRRLLTELAEHMESYFSMEEALLHAAEYPESEAHARSHRELLDRLKAVERGYERGGRALAGLLDFLVRQCFGRHLVQEDEAHRAWRSGRS